MQTVKVIDDHPGKHQDGIELELFSAEIGDYKFTTGFHRGTQFQGMFSEEEQPIQVLREKEDGWHFTMSNLGTLSREELVALFDTGNLTQVDRWPSKNRAFTRL
jgi:hypothetical protein